MVKDSRLVISWRCSRVIFISNFHVIRLLHQVFSMKHLLAKVRQWDYAKNGGGLRVVSGCSGNAAELVVLEYDDLQMTLKTWDVLNFRLFFWIIR